MTPTLSHRFLVLRVHVERKVLQDHKAFREFLGLRANLVSMETPVTLALKENKVSLVRTDFLELRESLVYKASKVFPARWDHKEKLVLRVRKANKGLLAHKVILA